MTYTVDDLCEQPKPGKSTSLSLNWSKEDSQKQQYNMNNCSNDNLILLPTVGWRLWSPIGYNFANSLPDSLGFTPVTENTNLPMKTLMLLNKVSLFRNTL